MNETGAANSTLLDSDIFGGIEAPAERDLEINGLTLARFDATCLNYAEDALQMTVH